MQGNPPDKEAVWDVIFLLEVLCHLLSNLRFLRYTFYSEYWGLIMSKALQDKTYSFLGNADASKTFTVEALIQWKEIPLAILNSDQTFVYKLIFKVQYVTSNFLLRCRAVKFKVVYQSYGNLMY